MNPPRRRLLSIVRLRKRLFDFFAVALIVVLALAQTHPWIEQPLATSIGHMEPGTSILGTDFARSLTLAGWMHFAPLTLHEWPLGHSQYQMFPAGGSHASSVDGLLLAGTTALLAGAMPLQTAHSVALVLAFVLSGVMVYRFAYRRFGRGLLALGLALAAACLPYIHQRAGLHPNLCYVWVFPLTIHLALNFQRRPSLKRALAWGLSFPLLALSSSYVFLAGLTFQLCATLGLLLEWRAWRAWGDPPLRRRLAWGAAGWMLGGCGVLLVTAPMLLQAGSRSLPDPDDLARYSVPLVQYLLPHPHSWLAWRPPFYAAQQWAGTTWEALAGGPVAALLIAPLFLLMRRVPGPRWVLGLALLGAFLLSAGPRLKLLHSDPLHHGIPMPMLLLTELSPKFSLLRHPGRMHPLLVYLALCATGYVLAWLRGAWAGSPAGRWGWRILVVVLTAVNLLWSMRFGSYYVYPTLQPHPFMQRIAAAPPRDGRLPGAILNVPASIYWFAHYGFEQFTHRRPLVGNEGTFFHNALSVESLAYMNDDPRRRFFFAESFKHVGITTQTLAAIGEDSFMEQLATDGIEYVIVQHAVLRFAIDREITPFEAGPAYTQIETAWSARLVYFDDVMRVYRTGPLPLPVQPAPIRP